MSGIGALGELALGEIPAGAGPEPVLEPKWHQPFTEPVRQKIAPALAIALIASGATVPPIAPFPETVTQSRWHQAWSEPVRLKPRLPETEQHYFELEPAPFVSFGWFAQLSAPVRIKPALLAGAQQFLAPDPLPRVSFGWWAGLSEPVRLKPGLPAGAHQVLAFEPAPIISIGWFAALAEPVRIRPAVLVPAGEQQFQPFDEDIIFADRWFAWWSEPVRVKPGLAAQQQDVLAFEPQPFPFLPGSGGWKRPPPEPDRRKVNRPGAPRQVEPAIAPPTFAEVIGNQTPAQLVDVLGSQYLPLLGTAPPAPDLYVPVRTTDDGRQRTDVPSSVVSRLASDAEEQTDVQAALDALDALDAQDRADVLALLMGKTQA